MKIILVGLILVLDFMADIGEFLLEDLNRIIIYLCDKVEAIDNEEEV